MTMPLLEPPVTTPSRSTGLLVASILCSICGIVCIGNPLNVALDALGLPGPQTDKPATIIGYAIGYASLAVTYFVAGSLLRKQRIAGGWIGITSAGVVAAVQVLGLRTATENTPATTVLLALNFGILVLLVFYRRQLGRVQPSAGEQPPRAISTPSKLILAFCALTAVALRAGIAIAVAVARCGRRRS